MKKFFLFFNELIWDWFKQLLRSNNRQLFLTLCNFIFLNSLCPTVKIIISNFSLNFF